MAKYRITGPDGSNYTVEAPEGAKDADVLAYAQKHFAGQAAPKAEQPAAGADDPGAWMSALIGAGRTTDQIIDGMKQFGFNMTGDRSALDKLAADQAEKAKLYKPLQDQHPIATAFGESVPGMVVPVGGGATMAANLGRLAVAGAAPAALEYGSAGERAGRAAAGAAAGVAGGYVVPKVVSAVAGAVPAVGRTIKAVTEPLYEGGRKAIVGRTLNRVAGDDASDVAFRMAGAAPLVPGSIPTAAQVAENGGMAALERATSAAQPAAFAERGMEQAAARTGALRSIAGDDVKRAAAVASRKSTTAPMYAAAGEKEVPIDKALQALLQRPSVQAALARAEKIAQEEGRTFGYAVPKAGGAPTTQIVNGMEVSMPAQAVQGKITGQTLQDIKMGMDALMKDPTTGIVGKEGANIATTRGQLMNWMEKAVPGLKDARTTYADMSKPINQMDVGQELLTRLEPALNDFGALGKETGAKYALALRNGDQTAVKATKFKGSGMADVMDPTQMELLTNIGKDLARKGNAQELGRGVGSDTFQKMTLSNIAERSGAPGVVNGALNLPGVSKVAKFLYSEPEEKIQTLIGQALLDPQMGAQLMQKEAAAGAVKPLKDLLFANPGRLTQIGGGLAGLTSGKVAGQ